MHRLERLGSDLRYVLRSLRRSPAFTLVVVAMLAVAIGVNTAVFTVVNAALFAGFPLVQRNDRIVYITTNKDAVYYPDFEEWRAQAKSFEDVALARNIYVTLGDDSGGLEAYFTTEVTADTFSLLGVTPLLGRDFLPGDQQPGAEPVAILRYDLWKRNFGGDFAIIGKSVRINGIPTTVVGVMPATFSFPTDQELWIPLVPTPAAQSRETFYARYAFARLADAATIEDARAEMDVIGRRLASAFPDTNRDIAPVLSRFDQWAFGPKASVLYEATWGAVAFVLLIACTNVASLLLDRALGRSREVSIRLALGAGRWRTMRQFLLESLILSGLAGAAGWWISKVAVRTYALEQASGGIERALNYAMGYTALAYLVSISVVTGLVVGLLAAVGVARLNLIDALKDGTKNGSTGGRRAARLSNVLVAAQMALALVLLTSAAVMIRSFLHVAAADVGADTKNVLSMSLYIADERYADPTAQIAFYENLKNSLSALPGVQSVAYGDAAPADYVPRVPYELADAPAVDAQSRPLVTRFPTGTTYFRTLGVSLLAGREFADTDRAETTPVAIVNERLVSKIWPGQDPIGKRLRLFDGDDGAWLTVVGVVSNVVQNDRTRQDLEPLVYVPYLQRPQRSMFVFARTAVAPESLIPSFRRAVYALDPDLAVPALWPLDERFARSYAFERQLTTLYLVFGAVALLLASVGVYATVTRSVSNRTQEIGVRTALGATPLDVGSFVFRSAAWPLGLGLFAGLAASLAATYVFRSLLVHVSPGDPAAFSIASIALVTAALLGCVIPARRALRVNPIIALRHE